MGELPNYDYGTYTFLACYMPQASGDGMEHRNSTYCVGNFALDEEKIEWAYGTVSHEFFHCWNVERIRPDALEPFNFEEANMSGELWFAEGFTNYYTDLVLCRAGLMSQKDYVNDLNWAINGVVNSPARQFFSPIEMSYYAPFSDAASSIDPKNTGNTFISYYTYGQAIGLALDLSLRNMDTNKSLDEYMRLVWSKFGKTEVPYSVHDLQAVLTEYTSAAFANTFFEKYILKSELPDYEKLLAGMGVTLERVNAGKAYLGANLKKTDQGIVISSYTKIGTPAYKGGLESGDIIVAIDEKTFPDVDALNAYISNCKPGQEVLVRFKRNDAERGTKFSLEENPALKTQLYEDAGFKVEAEKTKRRTSWLSGK
jgi:predicted metalloprotease with PDZ domain